jgi:hypothetical protein
MLNIRKNEGAVLDPAVVFRQDGAMLRASVVHHVPGRMRLRSPALKAMSSRSRISGPASPKSRVSPR